MSAKRAIAWAQQDHETRPAYHAFCHYRDLGEDRSIQAAWDQHAKDCETRSAHPSPRVPGRWSQWSSDHTWLQRVMAFDREIDEQLERKLMRQRLDMAERQAKLGRAMQAKAAVFLTNHEPENSSAAVRMADSGAKIERLALGEPTDNVDQSGTVKIVVEYGESGDDIPPDENDPA
ncbi:MAG TPA: hypothetical protein VFH61_11150 [Thermoleophilia bacterium]|nr:hypothetical protein [Thermoleophilia bacterium]